MNTPIAGLPEIAENQANKAITHNTALRQLEINYGAVISRTLTNPPGSPAEGALYIPATGATGVWSGQVNKIAQWANGGWTIYTPFQYQRIYSIPDAALIFYNGTTWTVVPGEGDMVRAAYDTNNNGIVDSAESVVDGAITTAKITNDAVTYAKIQNITTNRLLGRVSAGTGDAEEITIGSGLSVSGTTLSASGVSVTDGDKGDITVSSSGATWTIDDDTVTFPKIQNINTNRLLGRSSASSGDIEELQIGSGLSLSGGTLSATGGGGSAITVQDEGSNLTTALSSVNFTGAGVTATNSGNAVTVNIPGGSGGSSFEDLLPSIVAMIVAGQ